MVQIILHQQGLICMKKILKRLYFKTYEIIISLTELTISNHSERLDWSKMDCYSMLKSAGYDFRYLWKDVPDLTSSSIDLSLIVPVYNSEKYLEACLLSLLNQNTKFGYEIICVNDGSTDKSLKIVERLVAQYPNILRIINQENQGISRSRNKGITVARGQFIGFVDNDDLVTSDYVETFVSKMRKTNADMIQAGYDIVDSHGNLLNTISKGNHMWTKESDNIEKERLVRGLPWDGVFKKELFEKVRFPENFWYEDMLLRMLLMRKAKTIVTIDNVLYHYVMHSTNTYKSIFNPGNIKCIDQYWLLSQFLKYQTEILGLPVDDAQYVVMLKELSYLLWSRTKKLPLKYRKAVFCLASDLVKSLNRSQSLSPKLSKVEKTLLNKNFKRWDLLAHKLCVQRKYSNMMM